jgi:iron(III) transport system ATP-binding protein
VQRRWAFSNSLRKGEDSVAEVKIESVSKLFGEVKAVNNFTATVRDGEFVSILGPSGCGKTTMLRMIAGFEKASLGEIFIGDQLVSSSKVKKFLPPEKRNIGMVFQSYAVWPHMSVFDNVAYPLKIRRVNSQEIQDKTMKALELVHLDQYAQRFPNQLSGGQQQRVALARALVAEPRLLLLDEPLSNLDAKLRESMRFEIKELQKKLAITVIYVTHDQAEAMAMSDRIIVMHAGVIQQVDEPTVIYENPANQVVADFIGLVNFIEADASAGRVSLPELGMELAYEAPFSGKGVVAVRPEHIRLNPSGAGVKGTIMHRLYLGDATDIRVRVQDKVLRVIDKGNSYQQYSEGDAVVIDFDKLIVFPTDKVS